MGHPLPDRSHGERLQLRKDPGGRDPHLRSIRIDGDWRGIVFVPPRSDLYILLYVDHHDPAYRWAEHRKLTINPVTGAMQVVLLEEVEASAAPAAAAARPALSDTVEPHRCSPAYPTPNL